MPRYRNNQTGQTFYVENPDLNPQLISGATLVTDTSQDLSNIPVTPPSTINSSSFNAPTANFQTPNQTPVYPVSALNFELTEPERREQSLTEQAQQLQSNLLGESQYRAEQEETAGITGLRQTQRDLSNQLRSLQAEAQAIPLQIQNEFTGRGVTRGGIQPIEVGRLRENAIKALTTSALLQASQGNLVTALEQVDRAVAQRFDPRREELRVALANLELIRESPDYTQAQQRRAAQRAEGLRAEADRLEQERANFNEAQEQVVNIVSLNPNMDSRTLLELRQAQNPIDVLSIAQQRGLVTQKPEKQDFGAGNFGILQRILGRNPTRQELIDYERDISAAGRAPERPTAPDEPLPVLDIQRINELYGITVPLGSTQAQAQEIINRENSPEVQTRNLIVQLQQEGNSYETIVEEINNDATITDKETAIKIAQEVYGIQPTQEVAVQPVYGSGNFRTVEVNDRAERLSQTGFSPAQIRTQLIRDGYERNAALRAANRFGGFVSNVVNTISSYLFGE